MSKLNDNDLTLFNTISWILRKDYKIDFKDVLTKTKTHLEEEYEHYKINDSNLFIEKRNKMQSSRVDIIDKIKNYINQGV